MRCWLLGLIALHIVGCSPLLKAGDATFEDGDASKGATGVTRIENPFPEKNAYFGAALAFDGSTIVAAASGASVGTSAQGGRAYVFERNGTEWRTTALERPGIL